MDRMVRCTKCGEFAGALNDYQCACRATPSMYMEHDWYKDQLDTVYCKRCALHGNDWAMNCVEKDPKPLMVMDYNADCDCEMWQTCFRCLVPEKEKPPAPIKEPRAYKLRLGGRCSCG